MKKLKTLLVAVLLVPCMIFMAACGEAAHTHEFGAGVIDPAPTMDSAGTETFTCAICGEIKTETLPKLQPQFASVAEFIAAIMDADGNFTLTVDTSVTTNEDTAWTEEELYKIDGKTSYTKRTDRNDDIYEEYFKTNETDTDFFSIAEEEPWLSHSLWEGVDYNAFTSYGEDYATDFYKMLGLIEDETLTFTGEDNSYVLATENEGEVIDSWETGNPAGNFTYLDACSIEVGVDEVTMSVELRAVWAHGYIVNSQIEIVFANYETTEVELPAGLMTAPRNVTAEAGDAEVTLTWELPRFANGITGYEISVDMGVNWTAVGNVLNYTMGDLENGRRYIFLVRAFNAAGDKGAYDYDYSNPVAATPVDYLGEFIDEIVDNAEANYTAHYTEEYIDSNGDSGSYDMDFATAGNLSWGESNATYVEGGETTTSYMELYRRDNGKSSLDVWERWDETAEFTQSRLSGSGSVFSSNTFTYDILAKISRDLFTKSGDTYTLSEDLTMSSSSDGAGGTGGNTLTECTVTITETGITLTAKIIYSWTDSDGTYTSTHDITTTLTLGGAEVVLTE
jgi:hypothetical protein